jgi:hypothetical protein
MFASSDVNNSLWGYIVRSTSWLEVVIELDSFEVNGLNAEGTVAR